MIATVRPSDWNWLLFGHLSAAFLMIAGLVVLVLVSYRAFGAESEQVPLLRAIAFRTNLIVVVPTLIAIHVFGGILADREYPHDEPGWLGTAFAITSLATIVAVLLVFLQFWVLRRARTGRLRGWPADVATHVSLLLLVAMVVVLVLMSAKPT